MQTPTTRLVKHILIHKMLIRTLSSICALIGWVGVRKVGWILYWGYYYGFSNCVLDPLRLSPANSLFGGMPWFMRFMPSNQSLFEAYQSLFEA